MKAFKIDMEHIAAIESENHDRAGRVIAQDFNGQEHQYKTIPQLFKIEDVASLQALDVLQTKLHSVSNLDELKALSANADDVIVKGIADLTKLMESNPSVKQAFYHAASKPTTAEIRQLDWQSLLTKSTDYKINPLYNQSLIPKAMQIAFECKRQCAKVNQRILFDDAKAQIKQDYYYALVTDAKKQMQQSYASYEIEFNALKDRKSAARKEDVLERDGFFLKNGDTVEFIKSMGGGSTNLEQQSFETNMVTRLSELQLTRGQIDFIFANANQGQIMGGGGGCLSSHFNSIATLIVEKNSQGMVLVHSMGQNSYRDKEDPEKEVILVGMSKLTFDITDMKGVYKPGCHNEIKAELSCLVYDESKIGIPESFRAVIDDKIVQKELSQLGGQCILQKPSILCKKQEDNILQNALKTSLFNPDIPEEERIDGFKKLQVEEEYRYVNKKELWLIAKANSKTKVAEMIFQDPAILSDSAVVIMRVKDEIQEAFQDMKLGGFNTAKQSELEKKIKEAIEPLNYPELTAQVPSLIKGVASENRKLNLLQRCEYLIVQVTDMVKSWCGKDRVDHFEQRLGVAQGDIKAQIRNYIHSNRSEITQKCVSPPSTPKAQGTLSGRSR